ncbi:MAG: hypothetical protein WAV47_16565, partial [Blastocatellia bacterium]
MSIRSNDGHASELKRTYPFPQINARPTAPEPLPHIGLKGYLRLARVTTSFLLFMLRVLLNASGWRFRKTSESEMRRQEGAL